MYQIAKLIFSISPVVFGLILIFSAGGNIKASEDAQNWPTAPGTILEAKGMSLITLYGGSSFMSYEYIVDGNKFVGNRVSFGGGNVSVYRVNDGVTVYYNPLDFSDATLEVGFKMSYAFKLLAGFALIFVGKLLWKRL